MANRNYQFILYESNLFNTDLHPVTGVSTPGIHTAVSNITGVIADKRISLSLNNGGQVSFKISLDAREALDIANYEIRRCLVIYVDNEYGTPVPRWSGPIWNIDMSTDGSSMSVTAVGWQELLNHRELRSPLYFTNLDAGVIATRLLTTANNQNSNQNVVSATDASNPNSQRTGLNTGGANAEDLLFGAGNFETIGNFWPYPNQVWDPGEPPKITSEWALSGAGSLRLSKTQSGFDTAGGYGGAVEIPTGVRVNASGASVTPIDASSTYELRFSVNNAILLNGGSSTVYVLMYDANMVPTSPPGQSLNMPTGGVITTSLMINTPANAAYMAVGATVNITATAGSFALSFFDNFMLSKNSINLVPTPFLPGTIANPANPAGANRTRSYATGQKIGLAIEELAQIESGFDYEIAISSLTIYGATTILRNLNIYYDTIKGTIRGRGIDRPNTIFGYRWGPNNLKSARKTRDSSRLANRINSRSSNMLAMAQDPASIALRGMMEESIQLSDPGITPSTLLAYAGAEIVYRSVPLELYDIVPFPWDGDSKGPIPRLWVDYDIGDICYLVVDNGAMKIGTTSPQAIRIFGVTIAIDNQGNERIETMKTTYS